MGEMKPSGMTVLITGAGGFIGRHCVQTARARGHNIIAVVRSKISIQDDWENDPSIEALVTDLAAPGSQTELLSAVNRANAVIHTAASLSGDDETQSRDTVMATERLIDQIIQAPREQRRMVLVSSLSVYGADQLSENALLDEQSPIEKNPDLRDAYCRSKLAQEVVSMKAANAEKLDLFIMRVGAVLGPSRLWNSHLGHALGPILVRFGSKGEVPVTYIDNCAKALVLAAETPLSGFEVINVIDDDLPDRATYIRALSKSGWPLFVIPISWKVLSGVGVMFSLIPNLSKKLPGLLRPGVLRSRMMPMRYDNSKLKLRLKWHVAMSFDAAFKRSIIGAAKGNK
jgi:nucleoside-diphosphate-sugar epimerase